MAGTCLPAIGAAARAVPVVARLAGTAAAAAAVAMSVRRVICIVFLPGRRRRMRGLADTGRILGGPACRAKDSARCAPSRWREGCLEWHRQAGAFASRPFAINPDPQTSQLQRKTMDKFTTLDGVAAPLRMINVDTDMIIPKQYLKTIKRTGLGKGLFSEKRYNDDGSENPDFVLNKPAYRKSKILVAGDNFGCGSSREHAPWALMDFGIRCVISTSFGDIFYNNCFKNGVLPIKVSPEDLEKLFDDAERGANATLSIDLEKQEIRGPDGGVVKFEIDAHRKHCMLNGLDDIGLTMVKEKHIGDFEAKSKSERPWL
jgi:3-isopropylmalate/(R)-2-methylmalate dehydratase small subunit